MSENLSERHVITEGQSGGWLKNVLMWDWHRICMDGYPGWETHRDAGYTDTHGVILDMVKGRDRDSYDIAVEWDDLAEVHFHWREWLEEGGVFCREGDLYHARFDFQTRADRDRFHARYGGRAV